MIIPGKEESQAVPWLEFVQSLSLYFVEILYLCHLNNKYKTRTLEIETYEKCIRTN